jgi:hypothetical protein
MDSQTNRWTERQMYVRTDTCMYGKMHMYTHKWVYVLMDIKKDRYFYRCMNGCKTYRCIGRCMYGQMYVWTDVCMDRCMYGQMYVWTDVCMDRCMYGQMYVWTDVCMHRCMFT